MLSMQRLPELRQHDGYRRQQRAWSEARIPALKTYGAGFITSPVCFQQQYYSIYPFGFSTSP